MAGMITGAMPQQQAPQGPPPQDPGMPPEQAGVPQEQEDSPEDQEAYERFILAAQKLLYEDGMAEDVGKRLMKAEDKTQEMADIAYELMAGLDERTGAMLPDEMVAPAATEILSMIFEIARAAEVKVKGADVAGAAQAMITRYLTEAGASPSDIAQMTQGVDIAGAGAQIDNELGA